MNAAHGPYDTDEQAYADAAHVYDAVRNHRDMHGLLARINEGLLLAVLKTAGVELGVEDRRIVGWVAGQAPETVHVLIGLIERAYAVGRDQLAEEMTELHAQVDRLQTAARRGGPIQISPGEIAALVAKHADATPALDEPSARAFHSAMHATGRDGSDAS